MTERQLSINLFSPWGSGPWRLESSVVNAAWDLEWVINMAKNAERALFDAIFVADSQSINDFSPTGGQTWPEPITGLTVIAAHTEYLGVAGTVSTSYNEPYNTARQIASLDQLSGGRVGWNAVTGSQPAAAANFGDKEHPDPELRYARGDEYIEIVKALWESWDADAIVADKETGIFLDTSKVRHVPYKGKHFDVNALFNVPRSPQGTPMVFHAGSSDTGRNQGAKYADAIFTAQPTIEASREFYADFKRRVAGFGRNPEHVKVLPGILPIIGSTEEEAQRNFDQSNAFLNIEAAIPWINSSIHLDLSEVDLDSLIPEAVWQGGLAGSFSSRVGVIKEHAQSKGLTARQVIERTMSSFGHHLIVGTPEQIADDIELWFKTGAADGFNYRPTQIPESIDVFADQVLPLLQGKGIFRKEYKEKTLRGHYGLPVPGDE